MFWTHNINELLKPELILNNNMSNDEKLNTVMRFIIFFGIIISLISNNYKILIFVFILLFVSILIYNYNLDVNKVKELFLNNNKLITINNDICNMPTKENPLMNNNLFDNKTVKNNYPSCDLSNKKIKKRVTDILNNTLYHDTDNIYNKNNLDYILYTVPSSTSSNEQTTFAEWLYKDFKTCKEDGGMECMNNIYYDLRQG